MGLLIALIFSSITGHDRHHAKKERMYGDMHVVDKMEHQTQMETMMLDMTASLRGKTGDAFDRAFLSEMTVHHEGAIAMARLALSSSKRPEIIKLANDIIAAQTREINQMNNWRTLWFTPVATPTPTPSQTPAAPVACTMEARICPDGTAVGRQGPNCEFAPCPGN